jgi:hypothetical protein
MTTPYIQAALLSLEEKQVLEKVRADAVSGNIDDTARAAAAAAQADLDATELTIIADLATLRNAIIALGGTVATLTTV